MKKIKIDYADWKSSYDKWLRIIDNLKKKLPFDEGVDRTGWVGLKVNEPCGYCDSPSALAGCEDCVLFPVYCEGLPEAEDVSYFWKFMKEMTVSSYKRPRVKPNFIQALKYAKKILTRIKLDGKKLGHLERYIKDGE